MWSDAHMHLADELLYPEAATTLETLRQKGWQKLVVNGTSPADWPRVHQLATDHPEMVIPSYGLHPWEVNVQHSNWLEDLTARLARDPSAGVGECGLDRWIQDHDIHQQRDCLTPQIALATAENRPLSLHCIQAWGQLLEHLASSELPTRGFLVHAFSGSQEMAHQLLDLGAYFSYSTYFLHPRKAAIRHLYSSLPVERLLVETDAPSMPPPGREHNHPETLPLALESLEKIRSEPIVEQLAANFARFFSPR